jgi:hypothetical protein
MLASPFVYPLLLRLLPPQIAMMAGFFGPFVVMQLVFIWLNLWGPLDGIHRCRANCSCRSFG